MHRPLLYFLLTGLLLGINADVLAIATANDTISAQNPTNHSYSLDWGYIYTYKNSSSVAVDHYWILTAAHVADDAGTGSLVIDGETYTQQEIVLHPTADLALARYDKPFPGYYGLHAGEIHNGKSGGARVYDELIMAGYGRTGTVTQTTFENGPSGNGTKRWGTNEGIGPETTINVDVGGAAGNVSTLCFPIDFDLNDTDFEAGAAQHDSGGPVFIERDGTWSLTGISLYLTGAAPSYTGNYAAMVHDYISWIKSVIVDYDTDMDGLPDWWETLYGTGPTSMDPITDQDNDTFSNYTEWIADTDPTNSASHFQILDWQAPTNVTFSSSAGRKYQIEFRADLVDTNDAWQTEVDWFVGSSPETEKAVSSTTSNRFYRIRAKLP